MINLSLRAQTFTRVTAQGAGLFPLAVLVQSDGFFASTADSIAARNTTDAERSINVLVPEPEAFAARLRPEGWRAEWIEVRILPQW